MLLTLANVMDFSGFSLYDALSLHFQKLNCWARDVVHLSECRSRVQKALGLRLGTT